MLVARRADLVRAGKHDFEQVIVGSFALRSSAFQQASPSHPTSSALGQYLIIQVVTGILKGITIDIRQPPNKQVPVIILPDVIQLKQETIDGIIMGANLNILFPFILFFLRQSSGNCGELLLSLVEIGPNINHEFPSILDFDSDVPGRPWSRHGL